MLSLVFLLSLVFFSNSSYAAHPEIISCDRQFSLKSGSPGELIVERGKSRRIKIRLNHEIYGGAIDTATSMFVVYGSPYDLNNDNPQLMMVSIYKSLSKPKLFMRRKLGGGIYSANFSGDHKFIIVNTRFGDFVANIKNRKTELLAPSEPAAIKLAHCK
jgi:hypothetical protein